LAGSFLLITTPAFSRFSIGLTRGLNARLPAARADFYQRVRRLLTGGSLCPACALGGNRLAILFQDKVLFQISETTKAKHRFAAIPRFSLPTFFSREILQISFCQAFFKKAKRSSSTIGRARHLAFLCLLSFLVKRK
jgi:hypothetical protein